MLAETGRFLMGASGLKTPEQMFDGQREIVHLGSQPSLPQFRFEWHPRSQGVYVIDIVKGEMTKVPIGNKMAWGIATQGDAHNALLIWCRGYLAALEERSHNDQGKIVLIGEHS